MVDYRDRCDGSHCRKVCYKVRSGRRDVILVVYLNGECGIFHHTKLERSIGRCDNEVLG